MQVAKMIKNEVMDLSDTMDVLSNVISRLDRRMERLEKQQMLIDNNTT